MWNSSLSIKGRQANPAFRVCDCETATQLTVLISLNLVLSGCRQHHHDVCGVDMRSLARQMNVTSAVPLASILVSQSSPSCNVAMGF